MSYRNRTELVALLIGSTLAIASACGGLDDVKVIITDDAGSGGNPSGGNGTSGNHQGGAKPNGGGTSADSGAAGTGDIAGAAGIAGEASGGEGGQTPIPDPMPGPPTVTSVSPRDQSTGADPLGMIRIAFSEPLDPATVTADSVQIKDQSGAVVSGTLTYADAAATFKPRLRMNLLGTYSVIVTTAVTDAGKTAMERPFTSSFSVRDGVWGPNEGLLTTSTGGFHTPSSLALASDGVGRAVAVWAQVTGTGSTYDIFAALFFQGKGWAAPVKVNTNPVSCQYPSVSMNANGSLIAGWIEYEPAVPAQPYSVQARRNIGGTWDATSSRVDIASASAYVVNLDNIVVAMSANGHAHVAWDAWDYNGTNNDYGVFARHADANGVWDASVSTFSYLQLSSGASAPSMAFDADSNGFVAYQFATGTPAKISTNVFRYIASTNKWGTSAVASTAADGYPQPIGVATSPTGEAVLSWVRGTTVDASTTNYDLMGSYYNKAWSAPALISTAKTVIYTTKTVGASAAWTGSSFMLVWSQSGGTPYHVYANQYKAAWGTASIVSDGNHSSLLPWLAVDRRGNALAVWTQQSDAAATSTIIPADIASARFIGATDKWQNAVRVSSGIGGYRYPQAVTLADGAILATWQRTVRPTIKSTVVDAIFENGFQ